MERFELEQYVNEFRKRLDQNLPQYLVSRPNILHLKHFEAFPRGCCSDVSHVLGSALRKHFCVEPVIVFGSRYHADAQHETHAWVEVNSFVVDITADQFGEAPVIVLEHSPWHGTWEDQTSTNLREDDPERFWWSTIGRPIYTMGIGKCTA